MLTRSMKAILAVVVTVGVTACEDTPTTPTAAESHGGSLEAVTTNPSAVSKSDLSLIGTSLEEMNAALADRGARVRVAKAEWVSLAERIGPKSMDTQNHEVFADDRELRLESRWVPGDPRRDGRAVLNRMLFAPTALATGPGGGLVNGEPAIDASFDTWNSVTCSSISAVKQQWDGDVPSLIIAFMGFENDIDGVDIGTVGFLPGFIFDIVLGPGASDATLGVTFTFTFIDGAANPTDIDGDGRNDTAFKEVWYNDNFNWTTSLSGPGTDIETVALHENGHVFELGHFGKIHATFNRGKGNDNLGRLHVSPRAVMNAVMLGTQRDLLGTDNGAFCGNFGSWPNN